MRFIKFSIIYIGVCFSHLASYGNIWVQTDWSGGPTQNLWSDTLTGGPDTSAYFKSGSSNIDGSTVPGDLFLKAPSDTLIPTGNFPGTMDHCRAIVEYYDGTIYVGVDSVTTAGWNGFVFKSSDRGVSWTNTGSISCSFVYALLVTPDTSLIAGTDVGAFRSIDDGNTWNPIATLTEPTNVFLLIGDTIYAGTGMAGDVYKSTDNGISWSPTGELPGAIRIWALVKTESDTIYAGGKKSSQACVFKSGNGGVSWIDANFPSGYRDVYSLLAIGETIYAGTGSADSGDVWKYTGGTWTMTSRMPLRPTSIYSLIYTQDGSIYAGTNLGFKHPWSIYKSTDGGNTWNLLKDIGNGISNIYSLLQTKNHFIYAGTDKGSGNTVVYKAGYYQNGVLKSSVYEADTTHKVNYETVIWDVVGGNIEVWIWTSKDFTMWGADSVQILNSGDEIPVSFDSAGYIQYKIRLLSTTPDSSPIFKEIKISYTLSPVGIEHNVLHLVPDALWLEVSPNPFKSRTVIELKNLGIKELKSIELKIYDLAGRVVRAFTPIVSYNSQVTSIAWDGKDESGKKVKSGIYFVKLNIGERNITKKVVLLR